MLRIYNIELTVFIHHLNFETHIAVDGGIFSVNDTSPVDDEPAGSAVGDLQGRITVVYVWMVEVDIRWPVGSLPGGDDDVLGRVASSARAVVVDFYGVEIGQPGMAGDGLDPVTRIETAPHADLLANDLACRAQ